MNCFSYVFKYIPSLFYRFYYCYKVIKMCIRDRVKSGGVWRHYDATPTAHSAGPATDEEKANSSAMNGRKWPSSFPKAE